MKCICGYEDCKLDHNYDDVFDKPFIKIYSFIRPAPHGEKIITNKQIYACPKCGTLKIEVKN